MKKTIIFLMSFLLLLNVTTAISAQEDGISNNGKTYATLSEAIDDAKDGDELVFNGDVIENADITVLNKNITIDIKGSNGSFGVLNIDGGSVTIKDSANATGLFTVNYVVLESGKLTMQDVIFECTINSIILPDNKKDKILNITGVSQYLSKAEEVPGIVIRNMQKASVLVNLNAMIGVHDDPAIDAVGDLTLVLGSDASYTSYCGDVFGIYLGSPWWESVELSENDTYTINTVNESKIDDLNVRFGIGTYNIDPDNRYATLPKNKNYVTSQVDGKYVVSEAEKIFDDKVWFTSQEGMFLTMDTDKSFDGKLSMVSKNGGFTCYGIDMEEEVIKDVELPLLGKKNIVLLQPLNGEYNLYQGEELYLKDSSGKTIAVFYAPDTNLYELHYYPNGGTMPETYLRAIGVDDYLISANNFVPTKDGYIFDGWYTSREYTTRIDKLTYDLFRTNYGSLYAKWVEAPVGQAAYDSSNGLTITFSDEYKDMVKTLSAGKAVDGLPAYTSLNLKYLGSDYENLTGSIYNGDFYSTEYIKKVDDNTVRISAESFVKGYFIDGEYEITVSGSGVSRKNIGTVKITTGKKGEDYFDARVDELHVEIDESKLQLYTGDAVITDLGAKVTDENGNPVDAEVLLTKKSPFQVNFSDGPRDSFFPADSEPYSPFGPTPYYIAESEYYLTIDYHPLNKVYDSEFKIYLNGEQIEVNGTGLDKGFGSGGLGCMLYLSPSNDYRTSVSLGYPKAKMNKAEDVTQEIVEEKMDEIFVSSEDGSKKEYVDEVNNAASNTTISKALGEEGKVNVTLRNATVESVVEEDQTKNSVITKMSFDITPVNSEGDSLHGKLEMSITFRLPVDSNAQFTIATVYHEGTYLDTYEIMTDEKGNKYIEVTSDSFSVYDVYYANEKTLPGDVDGDGIIKGIDRILLRNYLTKKISSSDIKMNSADVNKDGDINAQDRVYLRNLVTGKIN